MAVLLENDMFTFWFWILVIGRYAIMFRFGTRFLALTLHVCNGGLLPDIILLLTLCDSIGEPF